MRHDCSFHDGRNDVAVFVFFFQAEHGMRYRNVTGVQTCALPISAGRAALPAATARAPRPAGSRGRADAPNHSSSLGAHTDRGLDAAVAANIAAEAAGSGEGVAAALRARGRNPSPEDVLHKGNQARDRRYTQRLIEPAKTDVEGVLQEKQKRSASGKYE